MRNIAEKPLSEEQPKSLAHCVEVLAGEKEVIELHVSDRAEVFVKVNEGAELTVVLAGEVRGNIAVSRHVELVGVGASVKLLCACRLAAGTVLQCDDDVRVLAGGVACVIDARCVGSAQSTGIFRQRVTVDPFILDANVQTSLRGIVLGGGARIRAIPELDISSNRITAKHSVAITRPSPAITAYFASRGVNELTAQGILADQLLCPITEMYSEV